MANGIRLISTDFDGTLIGHPSDGRCSPALAHALRDFKSNGGLWAVNTGRSVEHAVEGLALFDAPVGPDFLITHEREIYRFGADHSWHEFGEWNATCRARHRELFADSGPILERIRALVANARNINLIEEDGFPSGLITANEAVMDRVALDLDAICEVAPEFSYQRNTIYLRFSHVDYDKGRALAELCRLTGVGRGEVFAIGDHFNDLSMLDGLHAQYPACPANAISEVKAAVFAAGGIVARSESGDGVAEALFAARVLAGKEKPASAC